MSSKSEIKARVIDGKAIADAILNRIKVDTLQLFRTRSVAPGLAVIIVGKDPASQVYVRSKERIAQACGFHSVLRRLPREATQQELLLEVSRLNDDPSVHGILVQLPLPEHFNSEEVIQSIDPRKDVDGLHVVNAGKLAIGDLNSGITPCTPAGAMTLIRSVHGTDLSGLNAVVIGRSNLFGKPMAQLLLNANATTTVAHSRTANLPSLCVTADILVVAAGRTQMVGCDWIKKGATVIDVGINRIPDDDGGGRTGRLSGDVNFESVLEVAGAITPVPGGVGPMTLAMLMSNTLRAAVKAEGGTVQEVPY